MFRRIVSIAAPGRDLLEGIKMKEEEEKLRMEKADRKKVNWSI